MPPRRSDRLGRHLWLRVDVLLRSRRGAGALLVAAFSTLLVPLPDLSGFSALIDSVHVPLFALVGLLVRSLFGSDWGWGADFATLVVGALIGAGGELAQFWIPGRYPSLGDEALDLVGLPLGLVAYHLIAWQRTRSP